QAALLRPEAATAATVLPECREVGGFGRKVAREVLGAEHGRGAARPGSARRRFVVGVVHSQPASAMLEAVEAAGGGCRNAGMGELRKREAAGTSGDPVDAEPDAHPRIHLDEQRAQLVLGGLETKIADENGGRNGTPPLPSILPDHSSLNGRVRASTVHS